jgi:hypothetical protein
MIYSDQFYDAIKEALKKTLDPNLFELCVCELLKKDFPGIVPIQGGKDAGMDGAIPDAKGEPYQLICTTSKSVARNLSSSIKSYINAGRPRNKAVFATSKFLRQKERLSLFDKAIEYDFDLIQVYDGEAIALLLYSRPDWCQRLLKVTGVPSALSIIPKTNRPIIGGEAIGRASDIEWLKSINADLILFGQPGCGKTFLLHLLAKEGWGLFAVNEDEGELANAYRSKSPSVIIVDDAHVSIRLLEILIYLRRELGASYHLLATCWPGELDQIRKILNAHNDQIRELKSLSRDSMVDVIKQAGLVGPNALVREIITQSQGKPGLAVTLADLSLRGGSKDVQEVVAGEALARQIKSFFVPITGADITEILASFAIGGKAGMTADIVSRFLSIPLIELRHKLSDLSHGGVIQEHKDGQISVVPSALRYTLVKETFFSGPIPLDVHSILQHVVDEEDAFEVLVGAKAYGGNIGLDLLRILVRKIDTVEAWKTYSELGPEQAQEALEQRPQFLDSLARIGLYLIPYSTIPLLLDASSDDETELQSKPERPLRKIQDWIKEAIPGRNLAIPRRKAILACVRKWLEKSGSVCIGVHAISFVFDPHSSWTETDPGSGNTVTIYSAILDLNEIKELRGLWFEAKDIFQRSGIQNWPRLFDMLHSLMHPHIMGGKVPDGIYKECKAFAYEIIKDLSGLAQNKTGVLAELREKARITGFDLDVQVETTFDILYPTRDIAADWKEEQEKQRITVKTLFNAWEFRPIADIAEDLVRLEKAAQVVSGNRWPRWPAYLCQLFSQKSDKPSVWIDCLIERGSVPDLVQPFLARCFEISDPRCEEIVSKCISLSTYREIGIGMILKMPNLNKRFLDLIWDQLGDYSQLIDILIIRNEISDEYLKMLLLHNDVRIAEATAIGMWETKRNPRIPVILNSEWRKAVTRIRPEQYWLPEILQSDSKLAVEWLTSHLASEDLNLFRHDNSFEEILSSLSKDQRRDLLMTIKDAGVYRSSNLIISLIGGDIELFKILLSRSELRDYHLAPLRDLTADALSLMAREAVSYYDLEKIADAVFGGSWFWQGKASAYWKKRLEQYAQWKLHPDELVRRIADELVKMVEWRLRDAIEKEQHEEVYGL